LTRITQVEGRALPLRGNDIDTDRIIPGRYLKAVTFEGLERYMFEDDRKAWAREGRNTQHPFDDSRNDGASILIVNSNFGCGSSREHAPQGLQRWGFNAVIGESFAEIFFGNSFMIGMPCLTASAADVAALMDKVEAKPQAIVKLDLVAGTCEVDGFRCAVALPPKVKEAFATGAWDTTGMLLDQYEQVDAASRRVPYIAGF
jgi:3-isopropylmalate/(R)-2-methylmalate dehydratase small subunit